MRKVLATAGHFPFQVCAECSGIQRKQHQPRFAREVLLGGFRDLAGRRRVDIAIHKVDGRAFGPADLMQGLPLRWAKDLVDKHKR